MVEENLENVKHENYVLLLTILDTLQELSKITSKQLIKINNDNPNQNHSYI